MICYTARSELKKMEFPKGSFIEKERLKAIDQCTWKMSKIRHKYKKVKL